MEMSKGLKMAFGMFGITPEMLQNPNLLLQQFGINADDVTNKVAEFQQIGLRIEAAFIQNNVRLARIEKALGIDTAGLVNGADDGAGGDLGHLDKQPVNRRN